MASERSRRIQPGTEARCDPVDGGEHDFGAVVEQVLENECVDPQRRHPEPESSQVVSDGDRNEERTEHARGSRRGEHRRDRDGSSFPPHCERFGNITPNASGHAEFQAALRAGTVVIALG